MPHVYDWERASSNVMVRDILSRWNLLDAEERREFLGLIRAEVTIDQREVHEESEP
jgi:hypothetical protein